MTVLLKASVDVPADLVPVIAECERVTRERARNFWYGLKLTPGPARGAMYVIYAWMREADDLADAEGFAPEERVRRIAAFRAANPDVHYRLVENGRARPQNYKLLGTETITVGGKSRTATKVSRSSDDKQTIVWIVEGLPVPARILQTRDGSDDQSFCSRAVR